MRQRFHLSILWLAVLLASHSAVGQTTGTLRGVVRDPAGLPIVSANVLVRQSGAAVVRKASSGEDGSFEFVALPVGLYDVEASAEGFRTSIHRDVEISIGRTSVLDIRLDLGVISETVTTVASAQLIETTNTQLGASVERRTVVGLPLNARDAFQFLQLQPGVMSQLGADAIAGSDTPGIVSVNGGRGRSNNFNVNGGDSNDRFLNLPAIQPSPDAIEEFRVLTNTFDAEHGRNSGSVINVVTRSGTNRFHGNLFHFFRNKVLNSRGFFDTVRPDFQQNQFGGTLGGPIQKDRFFFFGAYEGRKIRQGIPSDNVRVPTLAEREGDFSAGPPFSGVLNDEFLASVLRNRPGCVSQAAPIEAGRPWAAIFPGNRIPKGCFDPTAAALLELYVPQPNTAGAFFQTSPLARRRADQGSLKLDYLLRSNQQLSFFYFINDFLFREPFTRQSGQGANLPGFGNVNQGRTQQYNLAHTWTLNPSAIFESRAVYFRQFLPRYNTPENPQLVQNVCGSLVPPERCFSDPANPDLGIKVGLGPRHEGVPFIGVQGGFIIGTNVQGEQWSVTNNFQFVNTFSKVSGRHSFKFGSDIRRQRYDFTFYGALNGQFNFLPGGVNDVGYTNLYPNFLLGIPSFFYITGGSPSAWRNTAAYFFAQDSWRVTNTLTLNYGLRYELTTQPYDRFNRIQAFREGRVTTQFRCRLDADNPLVTAFNSRDCDPGTPGESIFPWGLSIPGDPGLPRGLARNYFKAFAPRFGLAWSPDAGDSWLSKITGSAGATSIRAGWGLFYNFPIEGLLLNQFVPQPPFGVSSTVTNGLLNTPFLTQSGNVVPNPGGGILDPRRGDGIDFSKFRPMLLYGQIPERMPPQYSVQYNLTIQRKLGENWLAQLGYVGTQGHRLLATVDQNPGQARTCLDLNRILGEGTCGPFQADDTFVIPSGAIPPGVTLHLPYGNVAAVTGPNPNPITLVGLRPFSAPLCQPLTGEGCPPDRLPTWSSIFLRKPVANSNYHSLQTLLQRRFSRGFEIQAAYTWSKSIDNASSFENILVPYNYRLTRSLSLFDTRHRLATTYIWDLPAKNFRGWKSLFSNWTTTGILSLQTGFPIFITSSDDQELMGSVDFEMPGRPDLTGPFRRLNPKLPGNLYFDPNAFAPAPLGQIGNAPRTICCGPGIANWDVGLHRSFTLSEGRRVEFRSEVFNVLNKTQFFNPVGNISAGGDFGRITRARSPREVQFALKIYF
ncbi:MAG: TonB-dependent receptor [Bryobacteraceae bacterium]|nr:TonB-dependent receptor [Bryobacteraceae bacterium]MDW8377318.1 carboxypeptidase regulatory-like domain-containing protein [Bryobacterales bacterium]